MELSSVSFIILLSPNGSGWTRTAHPDPTKTRLLTGHHRFEPGRLVFKVFTAEVKARVAVQTVLEQRVPLVLAKLQESSTSQLARPASIRARAS